ncbi:MAG: MFS transporter [Chloroflexi bacterium]|nr:MFS transporter [Chloroflexota bacterium]MYD16361.1 MFS transporter [Chloroflexota bacterium]
MSERSGELPEWSAMGPVDPPRVPGPFRTPGFGVAWLVSGLAGAAFSALWAIQTVAIPDLDYSTRSFSALSLSGHIGVLAGVTLALWLGDRYPKRHVLRRCYFAMASCSAVACAVAVAGFGSVPLLHVTYVAVGLLYGLTTPVVWGLVAELVPRSQLAKAIVMLSWSAIVGSLLGLPLVISVFGDGLLLDAPYEFAFLYVALLCVVAALLTRRLPSHAGSLRFPGGFRDAVDLVIRGKRLRALFLFALVIGGCLAVFSSSVSIFAYFDLDLRSDLGWLFTAQGGAGVIATVGLAFVISGSRGWPTLLISGGIGALLCIAISATDTFWPLLALMIPFGAASSAASLGANAIAASHTKLGYFGRVGAMLSVGGSIFGSALSLLGIVIGDWGQGRSLIVGVGVVLLVASLLLFRTWRGIRTESSQIDGVDPTPSIGLITETAAPQKPAQSD